MIDIPVAFAERITQVDCAGGRDWLAALPATFDRLIERWELIPDGSVRHGAMALVLPVVSSGEPAVLKVSWRNDATWHEAAALRWWNGQGTVRLLRDDPDDGALLLQRLDPTRTMADLSSDDAGRVAGELIRLMAIPADPALPTVAADVAGIAANLSGRWAQLDRPIPRRVLDVAVDLAASLPHGAVPMMVNRDLWDGNVLAATRRPWLAIDPMPIAGDPAYAISPLVLRRVDRMDGPEDLDRFVRTVCDAAGLDRERAVAWSTVRLADYWLWALETGLTEDPLRCRRLLGWMT